MEVTRTTGGHETVIVDINYCPKPELNAESIRTSCSGIVLDEKNGLILSTGLLFGPLLQLKPEHHDQKCLQKLTEFFTLPSAVLQRQAQLSPGNELLDYIDSMCHINIVVESKIVYQGNTAKRWSGNNSKDVNLVRTLVALSKVVLKSGENAKKYEQNSRKRNYFNVNKDKIWIKTSATIMAIWKCPALDKVLDGILNQNTGWAMTDSASKKTSPDEEHTRTLLPFFTILKLQFADDLSDAMLVVNRPLHTPSKLLDNFDKTLGPYLLDIGNKRPAIGYGLDYVAKFLSNVSFKFAKDKLGEKKNDNNAILQADTITTTTLDSYLPCINRLCRHLRNEFSVGSPIKIVATPFGSLSPSVFLNSVSKGVIANLAGEDGILLMTDARCVPGCEGGALYSDKTPHFKNQSDYSQVVGIIIAPFCWRQNEWVGLTFGCSLKPLLTSLLDLVSFNNSIRTSAKDLNDKLTSLIPFDQNISTVVDCVSLIKVGSRWGSAVLVQLDGTDRVLLLTCRHVIQQDDGSVIRARFTSQNNGSCSFHVNAKVIYTTPAGQVYDIAILEIENSANYLLPRGIVCSTASPVEGENVYAVGHGLFDEYVSLPATVTSGNISKVLNRNGKEILVQSTCAVHPGVSGGALVSAQTLQLLGIIVCNARDSVCGASYPHINLSIPATILGPVLKNYALTNDSSIFNCLHDADPIVNCYWQLGDDQVGQLQSKL